MKIKIIVCISAFILCVSPIFSAYANGTSRYTEHIIRTAEEDKAQSLAEKQIMVGTENGMELDRAVSRAEAVTLAMRTFEVDTKNSASESFSDVPESHWAHSSISYARANDWINGTGDNKFEPERTVSGAEMCKILLAARGDSNITHENAVQTSLISGLFSTEDDLAIASKTELRRGDAAALCNNALSINTIAEFSVPTFAWNIKNLMPDNKNYCFSPYSIKLALAMLANGAHGSSQKEILDALGIDDLQTFNEQTKKQLSEYEKSDATVEVSDAIWLNETYAGYGTFTDAFKNTIAEYYNGEAKTAGKEHIINDINSWVNKKTHEKIPTILSEKENNSLAYLVNALYFKDSWSEPFYEDSTKDDTFHTRDNKKKIIPFMHKMEQLKYYGDSHTQIVRLPYNDYQFSMYIAMSDGSKPLDSYIPKMTYRRVSLSVPKFKQEFGCNLIDMFEKLGINSCLKPSSDFSPMLRGINEYYVSNALHKAYIDINEKGTEAAAVTAIVMEASSAMPVSLPIYIPFTADKPFSYFIYDENMHEILFLGEYAF